MQQNSKTGGGDMSANPHKSGYLFERKHGRVYQSWSRKYYSISDGELTSTNRNPKVRRGRIGIFFYALF
jgi:hypothetical protein